MTCQCKTCFGTMESTWTKAEANMDLMKRKRVYEELPNKNSSLEKSKHIWSQL